MHYETLKIGSLITYKAQYRDIDGWHDFPNEAIGLHCNHVARVPVADTVIPAKWEDSTEGDRIGPFDSSKAASDFAFSIRHEMATHVEYEAHSIYLVVNTDKRIANMEGK